MRSRLLAVLVTVFGMFWSVQLWAEDAPKVVDAPVELKVANRSIMVFRATILGEAPASRVKRAKAVIGEALDDADDLNVTLDPIMKSYMVLLGARRAFIVSPTDVDETEFDSVQLAAEAAADRLRQVVAETREARSLQLILRAVVAALLATGIYIALLFGMSYLRRRVLQKLPELMHRHTQALKVGKVPLIDANFLYPLVSRVLELLRWGIVLLLSYEWLGFVLSRFPYTRPWGESLNNYLLEVADYLLQGILGAIPGLGVALAIFFIARGATAFSRRILRRMATPGTFNWLNHETLKPTQRLTSLAIWLFALAMAYPYLPGAGTDAFKGLSVLVGLMISLGASSVVGQAAAGLILTYTRTLRPGEFVRIGEHEGTVTELGMFTTSIRTGLGEVLTLPNSMITGTVTKNYSRVVQGPGYVVDTVVTIGYDTPWRQVEGMLLEAARRTPGVLETPPPQVFQTALSDFYPEYRLVAQAIPSQPRPRAVLLSMLHANIQDVFNEYGVQIMSPHYLGDPQQEKWVPRDKWYMAPAQESKETLK
ncbi:MULTISPECIES: mechanosensitive ion channel family protein [unclassified Pseudomonas]|uniref:mechanosensitive ion channel family protein n=1 Tax=unclassified Pseudomonas TaxID=196821 RepID=UPI000C88A8B5|nr:MULTISPECIES: mechanosensitive ion channel domain-containing protein [unclassified Pseudomonas]PMZ91366.1 mechanosensitive ion channel protein MscS [Pseudomonas sp. FW215-T2]PNA14581.1 mechanosensitive ion channel protein MscS [Pseudomonas sp. FW215-R3]PNB38558.1 mechanosensitive ion channel protein MscS [Pseudomonas sp. FW305-131]